MIDIFRSLKSLLKISRIHIDNTILRLHYSVTVIILFAFCVIVTTKQYVGEPIDCIRYESVPQSVINTYCWIHTTYTIPKSLTKKVGIEVPHPGVDNTIMKPGENNKDLRYHKYYQWVCFVLFLQATLFYIPRWLWKWWEGGKIQALVTDLSVGVFNEHERKRKKDLLVYYLRCSRGHHNWYAAKFFFCELLALANVIGQMFLLDKFLDGEFMRYGIEVIEFHEMDDEDRIDPMIRIFPKVTKCNFFMYGPSANIQNIDALCLLPLNIINEKIYIFIWFWFSALTVLTSIMILVHLIIIACQPVRTYLLNMRFKMTQLEQLHTLISKTSIGDWFLLYMLGQNIDEVIFKEILEDLLKSGSSQPKETQPLT
ncbi:Innexin shaking-B-like protein [Dinothrombium tinctorium]|uniref:Innexin n=1 Tax=Dinothrombium tinctorium TaxID=1965070 RepID=A0A443RBL2_9ACAR|nr:Innexin shaking-B-like protein [Dinothrombium tinctorium]